MALGLYDWFYGVAQFSAAFLSLVAMFLSFWMLHNSWDNKGLKAWRFLLVSLILFGVEEIIGALVTFGVIKSTFLTHVIPSFIMIFMIAALIQQILTNYIDNRNIEREIKVSKISTVRSSASKKSKKKQKSTKKKSVKKTKTVRRNKKNG